VVEAIIKHYDLRKEDIIEVQKKKRKRKRGGLRQKTIFSLGYEEREKSKLSRIAYFQESKIL